MLASVTAIAIFSLASGIVFGIGTIQQSAGPFGGPIEIGPSLAQIVQRSTGWATPLLALLALGAIGAAWWEVEGWDSLVSEEESSASEQDYETAFGHLLRVKGMVTCAIAVLAVLTVADVALVVSTFALDTGQPNALVASQDIAVLAEGIGTLLLVVVGALAAFRLRESVQKIFNEAGADEDPETPLDGS